MDRQPFLQRVRIRNFKSIADCDVELGRLNLLVGRNGAGKSNFLEAIRFVSDGLEASLDHAIRSRGGIDEVRRRSTGHPHNFLIELSLNLPDWKTGHYGFEVSSREKGGFQVRREWLEIQRANGEVAARFRVENGTVESTAALMPKTGNDRLYLVAASGVPEFETAYEALRAMGFYNLNPQQMRELQSPDAGELLRRDGSNIASVIARLSESEPALKDRVKEYLAAIVPEIADFDRVPLGPRETLMFRQQVKGAEHPWRFYAANMSDGTLRALGILIAAMQLVNRGDHARLVGIEEPETALHPAAAGALMDSLREAATTTQVLLTTHSPDLLDRFDLEHDTLLVVQAEQGVAVIGPADPASRDAIRQHLYSAGELLRMDQLQPDRTAVKRQTSLDFDTPVDQP